MAVPLAGLVAGAVKQYAVSKTLEKAGSGKFWLVVLTVFALPLVLVFSLTVGLFSAVSYAVGQANDPLASVLSGGVVAGSCAPDCPGVDGQHEGSVDLALGQAVSEIGKRFPTGWSAPGECIGSVRRWLAAGGVTMGYGNPVTNYSNAVQVVDGSLRPGDVVQYTNVRNPASWAPGVHTYMVLRVHGDGTHDIIESNYWGHAPGTVGVRLNQKLDQAPPGWRAVVWRYFKSR